MLEERVTRMWIVRSSGLEIAQETSTAGAIALGSIRVRLGVERVRRTHQWTFEIALHPLNQVIPIGWKQILHPIGIASVVLVDENGSVVHVRCRQIHNDGMMIEHPVGARRINTVHGVDTIARIQESLSR